MGKSYKKTNTPSHPKAIRRHEDAVRGPTIGPRDYETKYRHNIYHLLDTEEQDDFDPHSIDEDDYYDE